MKVIQCEMCGCNEFLKQDGLFICQSCGTKYTVEEAKKMMIEGTVKIDKSDSILNFLQIARNAYDSGNKIEAEKYCNKIIEIDDTNYEAWLIKGKSAGWQSTIARSRIDEAVNCFSKSLENAPGEMKEKLKKDISDETSQLILALNKMSCDLYEKFPSSENANKVVNVTKQMISTSVNLMLKCGTSLSDLNNSMAHIIASSSMKANNNAIREYTTVRTEYTLKRMSECCDNSMALIELSLLMVKKDTYADKYKISLYSHLISVQTMIIDQSKCFSLSYDTSISCSDRQKKIMEWHRKWKEIDNSHEIPEPVASPTDMRPIFKVASIVVFILLIYLWLSDPDCFF